jgi:hypothetical protein
MDDEQDQGTGLHMAAPCNWSSPMQAVIGPILELEDFLFLGLPDLISLLDVTLGDVVKL